MTIAVKIITKLLGITLLVFGIAGFFVNGYILSIEVDTITNAIHIVAGLIGLSSSATYSYARSYLIVFGILFGAIGVAALSVGGSVFGIIDTNTNGTYAYLILAAVMLVIGFGSKKRV